MSRLLVCSSLIFALLGNAPAWAQIALQIGAGKFAVPVRSFRDIPFRTVVRQQYDYSCGSAALATLLHYHYGKAVGEEEIFKSMYLAGNQEAIRKAGFSLLDMKRYLKSIGFEADGYRIPLEEVAKGETPVITVLNVANYRHFVLIKGIENGLVLIGDPSAGLRKIPVDQFKQAWNGIVFGIRSEDAKGVFNARAEWLPYASSPLTPQLDRLALGSVGTGLPILYQVLQLTALVPSP